jgi:hypothetical protein
MATVDLRDQIIDLDKILSIESNELTIKDIISLIFHTVIQMASDNVWKKYYHEFESELAKQNELEWPKFSIMKNDYDKRFDIILFKSFLKSNHLLMLLLRLLYVENYKSAKRSPDNYYHDILLHKMTVKNQIQKLSLTDLFELLKKCVDQYIKVYNHEGYFEYQLGDTILCQIIH